MKRIVKASAYTTYMRNRQKFAVHQSDIDDPKFYSAQITEIHPYDDADYYWAKILPSKKVRFIYKGKVVDTMQLHQYDPDDYESPEEYYDDIIDWVCVELRNLNRDIESRILHN